MTTSTSAMKTIGSDAYHVFQMCFKVLLVFGIAASIGYVLVLALGWDTQLRFAMPMFIAKSIVLLIFSAFIVFALPFLLWEYLYGVYERLHGPRFDQKSRRWDSDKNEHVYDRLRANVREEQMLDAIAAWFLNWYGTIFVFVAGLASALIDMR